MYPQWFLRVSIFYAARLNIALQWRQEVFRA